MDKKLTVYEDFMLEGVTFIAAKVSIIHSLII